MIRTPRMALAAALPMALALPLTLDLDPRTPGVLHEARACAAIPRAPQPVYVCVPAIGYVCWYNGIAWMDHRLEEVRPAKDPEPAT